MKKLFLVALCAMGMLRWGAAQESTVVEKYADRQLMGLLCRGLSMYSWRRPTEGRKRPGPR